VKDFIVAEWKTLLFVGIALSLLYVLFIRDERVVTSKPKGGEPLVPGQSYDGINLGDSAAGLGDPDSSEPLELGLRALHFAQRGLTVYVFEEEIVGIRRDLTTPEGATPIAVYLPKGANLVKGWGQAQNELGPVRNSFIVGDERILRFDGAIVLRSSEKHATTPTSVIVVGDNTR